MRASLYHIPEGCICKGDGLFGMACTAKEHARLKEPATIAANARVRISMSDSLPRGIAPGAHGVVLRQCVHASWIWLVEFDGRLRRWCFEGELEVLR